MTRGLERRVEKLERAGRPRSRTIRVIGDLNGNVIPPEGGVIPEAELRRRYPDHTIQITRLGNIDLEADI